MMSMPGGILSLSWDGTHTNTGIIWASRPNPDDGPKAVARPFVDTFADHDQQHFAYLSQGGAIWDAFFFAGDNKWHLQQINLKSNNSSGMTDGPMSVAGPFINTFTGHDQQHFAYLSEGGAIWDAYFFAGDNKWHLQQINLESNNSSGMTDGPVSRHGPV